MLYYGSDTRSNAGRFFMIVVILGAAIALIRLGFSNWLVPGAIVYVVAFVTVAWRYPAVALGLIFAAAPFQNDLSQGGFTRFSAAEVNLALTLPVFLCRNLARKRPLHAGPITIPVLIYFAICFYSSSFDWRGGVAELSILQMVLYFIIAVMIFASFAEKEEDLLLPLNMLSIVGVFLSIALMASGGDFLGLNKNGAGSSLSCSLLVTIELWLSAPSPARKKLLAVGVLIQVAALIFTLSRGSWAGFMVGLLFILFIRRELRMAAQVSALLIPVGILCWMLLPAESRTYATGFDTSRYNISARIISVNFAEKEWQKQPLYGVGVGLRKQYDATNVVMSTLAETGVLGLAAFLLIHVVFYRMIWTSQRFFDPTEKYFSLLVVGGALVLVKFTHGMVDHYWSRGAVMMAWDAGGMATAAYYIALRRSAEWSVRG